MQTRTALRHLSGGSINSNWGDGPLSQVADQLLEAFRVREADRMERAELAAGMVGTGPMLAALQRRFAEQEEASLYDASMPMVMRFDAQQLLLDASRAFPTDRGLKLCAAHAKELWMKEPDGVLAVGDVMRMRAHWSREYPRSKVAHVLDHELPKVGFNTLPVQKLASIATNIRGRDESELKASLEAVCRAHGLDGDKPHQVRARAYLCGLVNLTLPDDRVASVEPGGEAAADRALFRMAAFDDPILRSVTHALEYTAQGMTPEALGAPPSSDENAGMPMGPEMGDALAPHEDEVPHEEGGGTVVETTSPITGEPMVLELELAAPEEGADQPLEEAPMEGAPGEEALDVTPDDVASLPHFGQLEDFGGEDVEGPPGDGSPMDLPGELPMADEGQSVSLQVEDPTAPGEMLEVSIQPAAGGPGEGEGGEMPAVPTDLPLEIDSGHIARAPRAGMRAFAVYAIRGGVKANEPLERFVAESMPRALRHVARGIADAGGTSYAVKAPPEQFHQRALIVLDEGAGNHLYVVAEDKALNVPPLDQHVPAPTDGVNLDPEVHQRQPAVPQKPSPHLKGDQPTPARGAMKQLSAMTKDEIAAFVEEKLGLTASAIEATLLEAEPVRLSAGQRELLRLEVNNQGRLELKRQGKLIKTSGLEDMDQAILDFIARAAAEYQGVTSPGTRVVAPGGGRIAAGPAFEVHPLFLVGCAQCGKVDEYLMPKEASAVSCGNCGYQTPAYAVATQMNARQAKAFPGYVILSEIPGQPQELELNARRIMADVMRVAPHATGRILPEGRLEVQVRPVDDAAMNRIRNVLETRFGIRSLQTRQAQGGPTQQEMQTTIPSSVSNVNMSNPLAPTYQSPAVQPSAPIGQGAQPAPAPAMSGPSINVQAPQTAPAGAPAPSPAMGNDQQQKFMRDNATIKPAAVQRPGAPPIWRIAYRSEGRVLHQEVEAANEQAARRVFAAYDADAQVLDVRLAQAAPPAAPVPPVDEAAGGVPPPDAGVPPGGAPPPGAGIPGASPGVVPGAGKQITPEVEEAIRAAMLTFRNTGVDIATGIGEFQSQFKQFIQSFGDENGPGRAALGATIIKAAQEAWSKPALINAQPTVQAHRTLLAAQRVFMEHAAAGMSPGRIAPKQNKDRVSVPGDAGKLLGPDSSSKEPKVMNPGKIKTQHGKPDGKLPDTSLGSDSSSREAPWTMNPPADGSYGLVGEGTSLTPTDLGTDSQNATNPTTSHWDSVSEQASGHIRSKPGGAGAPGSPKTTPTNRSKPRGATREDATQRLASLAPRIKPSTPSSDATFWALEAIKVAGATGQFPEQELWSARDAGLDEALPRLAPPIRDALGAALSVL